MGSGTQLERRLEALLARGHRGMVLGLDRTLAALHALGDPHERLRAFHVAGSNGKGSVSAMIDAALGEAGIRRGLFTSPHLERFNERIAIDGRPIGDDPFEEALARVFTDAPGDLTFFETLTIAAFVAFEAAAIEVAVLEVGLGGRLDSTNVIDLPLAAGIVSITTGEGGKHLEHADLLGDTIEAIAREKAGIFKRNAPAVIGLLDPRARDVVLRFANETGASPIVEIDRDRDGGRARLRDRLLTLPDGDEIHLAPSLPGDHQIENAAVAATMLHLARPRLPALLPPHIERGISSARWPGRLERVDLPSGVTVLLDAAHNLDGARVLVRALGATQLDPERTVLVFGALADKPFAPFLELVAPFASRRIYTEPGGRAPAPLDRLDAIAPGARELDPRAAIDEALRIATRGDLILVTGSIYLVGTVRAHLAGARRDPALGL